MASNGLDSLVETALKDILKLLDISYKNVTKKVLAGQIIFSVEAPEEGPRLIGAHGDTIHALDFLVKRIIEKRFNEAHRREVDTTGASPVTNEVERHFLIDVNGYREQKVKDLQAKALMMAERARSFQYDVELYPMSAYERLIVHTTLQDAPNVKTESQGEGRNRRVVIRYTSEI